MQGFILKGDLQFSKFLKNTICIGLCKLKCTEKRSIPFSSLHFLPEFVPHTEFKGRPEDTKWNVLYHTALRNYAAVSLQVPSILSILLASDIAFIAGVYLLLLHGDSDVPGSCLRYAVVVFPCRRCSTFCCWKLCCCWQLLGYAVAGYPSFASISAAAGVSADSGILACSCWYPSCCRRPCFC